MAPAARAQDTNAPSPQFSTAPSIQYSSDSTLSPVVETNLPAVSPPVYAPEPAPAPPLAGVRQVYVPAAVPLPVLPPLLRSGPLTIQPHVYYRLSYADGLQTAAGQRTSSLINEVDPGVLLRWGDHWSLDYTALTRFYSSSDFRNTFDNAVTLTGGTVYEDWTFGLSQGYASSSDPIIETGAQTDQQTYSTGLNAVRQMGSQTSLELGANQSFRFLQQTIPGEALSDSRSWSTMDWLDYQFWSRLSGGIGVGFGYSDVSASPDMTSEQIQGRVNWQVVDKLRFVLSAGAQDMQFLGSGASDLISPVFSLSAQYALFDVTTLSLSGYSSTTPSYFQDQVSEITSITAGLHQRLLGRLFLDLNGGYSSTTYHASTSGPTVAINGNYDTTFFSARLGTTFLKRGTAGVFYSKNFNSSDAALYNYDTSTVGFELTYRY